MSLSALSPMLARTLPKLAYDREELLEARREVMEFGPISARAERSSRCEERRHDPHRHQPSRV